VIVRRNTVVRPIQNPPNPWSKHTVEYEVEGCDEGAPPAKLELYEERARSIVSENDSPDVGFRCSVNPYRGCIHGCAYCYARPSHQYLGFGAGTDFDRRIVVKTNAPELLREHFERRAWTGETVIFSGNTDCYQPVERHYELTKRCLEVCLEFRNPVGIITKSTLILRDLELLEKLSRDARLTVWVSVAFDNDEDGLAMDPWAPRPSRRLEVIRRLTQAGIRVGVSASPVIFGLNDAQIPTVLAQASERGATRAFSTLVRLPRELREVFVERVREAIPGRAKRIESALIELRGGRASDSEFGARMVGSGPRWEAFSKLFDSACRKLGLNEGESEPPEPTTFRRVTRQQSLF
jgi:DNA repair photolyase